ncbi:hypothetical protein D3C80_279020 [compost metagenome]
MRVKNVTAKRHEPSPSGFRTLAQFSFEPAEGVLIYDCTAVKAPDDRILIYGPPSRGGSQILSLAPDVRRQLIEMVIDEVQFDDDSKCAA